MGKRKERRQAAHSNVGRRMKLDLSAEPSGELGGSSIVKEELGEDMGLIQPKSPSSSGQEPQNPLQLLGQYSDDELEEEPRKIINQAPSLVITPASHMEQDRSVDNGKDDGSNVIDNPKIQTTVSQVPESANGVDARAGDMTCFTDACKQVDPYGNDAQVVGDVNMGWKMVLHEESNQYYYWNTETGETSWDIPAYPTEMTTNQKASDTENRDSVAQEVCEPGEIFGAGLDHSSSATAVDGSAGGSLASQSMHDSARQVDDSIEGQQSGALEQKNWVDHVGKNDNSNAFPAILVDGLDPTNCLGMPDDHKKGMELPLNLVTQCESLLERLTSLRGSDGHSQALDWISTYITEVEVRLSDIRSLSSHGTSLLPFWIHTGNQVSQLEDTVNKKIYELAVSAQMEADDDDDAKLNSGSCFKEKERSVGSSQHESETNGYDNSGISAYSCPAINVERNLLDAAKGGAVTEDIKVVSLDSLPTLHDGVSVPSIQVNGTSDTTHEFQAEDDIDMEVDMEVEETISGPFVSLEDVSDTKVLSADGQLIQTTSPPGDLSFIPPPLDDEWIPPPPPDHYEHPPLPPDNEQVPPPPPDEPNEPSYQALPSHAETAQPLQYAHAYNICYADPTYQCYGNAVVVPNNSLYMHSDPSQVGGADPSLYYGTVPLTYAEAVFIPAEPVAYYDLQNGSVAPVPSADSAHSSILQMEIASTSHGIIAPTLAGRVIDIAEAGASLKVDELAGGAKGDSASNDATGSASVQNVATVTDVEEIGEDDTSATTAVRAQVAAVKVQSKALRSKKRTVAAAPSLRSNKKVSSLVDKWKAAKEELNEDEEEPEDAYEKMEKKRQREIEVWKAKQIASGEAKDNANFQPLGGDWRERVKRRRAQAAAKDSTKRQMEAPIDKLQQPDLAELSNGLPTGWQVYWDEASKSVYYGNTKTLETTWTRPTKCQF